MNRESDRLDAALEARTPVAEHDARMEGLTSIASALRDVSATGAASLEDGEERALRRLRAAVRARQAQPTGIETHPRWRMPRLQLAQPAIARIALAAAVVVVGVAIIAGPGNLADPVRAAARTLGLSSQPSTKVEVRLAATSADPLASGKAKGEQRSDRTRFSLEVEDVSSAGAHSVRITRGGAPVTDSAGLSINVDALGAGQLELNTQDGATHVPVVQAGDLVEVLSPSGEVILSETLLAK